MEQHLKRVLRLVKKTGSTMIVVDKQGDEAYAVMDLDAFELLVDGQVNDLEAISNQIGKKEEETKEIWDVMKSAGQEGETWDMSKMSEKEMEELAKQYQEYAMRPQEEPKNEQDQVVSHSSKEEEPVVELDLPEPEGEQVIEENEEEEEDFGEEQFYLEPVE